MKSNREIDEFIDIKIKGYVEKMNQVREFAKKVPVFSSQILDGQFTEKDEYCRFSGYKNLYLGWGINRLVFEDGKYKKGDITNYNGGNFEGVLYKIYVNTLDIYGSNSDFDLCDLRLNEGVFFYDTLNSTFYIEEKYIESFLESLLEWADTAKKLAKKELLIERKKLIEEELERVKEMENEK